MLRSALALAVLAGIALPATAAGAPLEAYFPQRSYGPGQRVLLMVFSQSRRLAIQVFRAGPERTRAASPDIMNGVAVSERRTVRRARRGWGTLRIWLGRWPSGLYFVRLRSAGGEVATAPVVLRAGRRRSRVAVVLPTHTWQAYNLRDDDGDGAPDTWYARRGVRSVQLARPYRHHGVPPHFRQYDAGFLRWLAHAEKQADFLADDDLDRVRDARQLTRRYDLIVFPGHEEYVTTRAYGVIERYVARGGNLMMLSANNFFYRVLRRGSRITRAGRWRDLGRPEGRWLGVQYVDWNHGVYRNRPYTVVGARAAPWLFAGTGLADGDRFGAYGIEIDATGPFSPPGTHVLARIRDIFGVGASAEMTYYESASGAKVFAAGALDFGGSATTPPLPALLENLWSRLSLP